MRLAMRPGLSALVLLASAAAALGQPSLTLPQQSARATASQTVGLTEISIVYHRPAINQRKVWGGLVPWNEVWRAGANENTTIQFSTPVSLGGKPLPAGTYGLHMIPTEGDWTVAFSNVSSRARSWTSRRESGFVVLAFLRTSPA